MRARAAAFGVSEASFRTLRGNEITVQLPGFTNLARAEQGLGTAARLNFYDWEADALTPNGKTVASQLQAKDPAAVTISQGSGATRPGAPGAGSMSLYSAVKLAANQPRELAHDNARLGSQYYLFGAPNSRACSTAARDVGEKAVPGAHCLLSGPAATIEDWRPGCRTASAAPRASYW